MISSIIFDVGGVLIRTEDYSRRNALEDRLGLRRGQAEQLVFNSKKGRTAQQGQITSAELWQWIRHQLNLDESGLRQFREEFFGGDRLNTTLLAFIQTLRPRYQTAIISNFTDNLHQVITEFYPLAAAFDVVVGSAYEGVMKPDPEIYRRTLNRLGKSPAEAVFVDDFVANVEGARAVGMHAIHYTPQTNVPAELAKLGVTIN